MRILYIAAGAGDMHCGSCTRDLALVRGLIARGHDVQLMPLYTPIRDEDQRGIPSAPLHYGGINVYLQQVSEMFSRLPAFMRQALDSPGLLRWAAGRGVSTQPSDLAEMTLSVLRGDEGRQGAEAAALVDYLKSQPPFDVINLTNSLLSGLAPVLRKHLESKLVCTVQGEDGFLEAMGQGPLSEARALMRKNARHIDLFIATGFSYARSMTEFLGVTPTRMRTVLPGLDVDRYHSPEPRHRTPFTIGYLSVIHPKKGLHHLVHAVAELARGQERDVFLRIGGRVLDKAYWRSIQRTVQSCGIEGRIEYHGEVADANKAAFLHSLSAFCLPTQLAESRGMVVLESLAAGVPVVVPSRGVFPELLERTDGGLLVRGEEADDYATALAALQDHPDQADAHGQNGAVAVKEHHDHVTTAETAEALFERVCEGTIRVSDTALMMRDKPPRDATASESSSPPAE